MENEEQKNNDKVLENFDAPDLRDVDYSEQQLFFKAIQTVFTNLNLRQSRMSVQNYKEEYLQKIEDIATMAVTGNVPAMDYLCFLYKRGVDGILDRNLTRAHEWGIFAVAAGSKLSIERLRLFFEPVYDYVLENGDIDAIEAKNEIQDDEMAEFIAYSFCNVLIDEMKLTLLEQSQKPLNSEESFQEFSHYSNEMRSKALPKMLDLITK